MLGLAHLAWCSRLPAGRSEEKTGAREYLLGTAKMIVPMIVQIYSSVN